MAGKMLLMRASRELEVAEARQGMQGMMQQMQTQMMVMKTQRMVTQNMVTVSLLGPRHPDIDRPLLEGGGGGGGGRWSGT